MSNLPTSKRADAEPATRRLSVDEAIKALDTLSPMSTDWSVNWDNLLNDTASAAKYIRKSPLVYACVSKIADDVASPRYFEARITKGDGEDAEHELADLLNHRANPETSAFELRRRGVFGMASGGTVYVHAKREKAGDRNSKILGLVELVGGTVTRLTMSNHKQHRVTPTPAQVRYAKGMPSGTFGFLHEIPATGNSPRQRNVYEAADVAVLELPRIPGLTEVLGPIQAARRAILTGEYLDTALSAILKNDGMATTIYSLDADDAEVARASQEHKARVRDPEEKGGGLWVKAGKIDAKRVGFSPSDLDVTGTADYHDRQVLRTFRLSTALLGETSGETFSNAAEAVRHYIEWTLEAWLQSFFGAFELLLPVGHRIEWDTTGIPALREDEKTIVEWGIPAVEAGIIHRDDLRERLGLEALGGVHEQHLVKVGIHWIPLEQAVELGVQTLSSRSQPSPPPALDAPAEDEETDEPAEDDKAAPVDLEKGLGEDIGIALERLAGRLEGTNYTRLYEFLKRIAVRAAARARDLDDVSAISSSLLLTATEERELVQDAGPWLLEAVQGAVRTVADGLGDVPLDPGSQTWKAIAERRAAALPVTLETARDDLARTLTQALDEGWSIDRTARAVENTVADPARARRIAQTETIGAVNEAAFTSYGASGVVEHVRWVSALDDLVRPSHAAADGQVRVYGEPFSNGLIHPHQPGAPAEEVVNCRCSIRPARLEEDQS